MLTTTSVTKGRRVTAEENSELGISPVDEAKFYHVYLVGTTIDLYLRECYTHGDAEATASEVAQFIARSVQDGGAFASFVMPSERPFDWAYL